MATSRNIPRAEWQTFFNAISDAVLGKRAEVETASLDLGDQVVAESLPLIGITFDSRDNLLDVAMTGLTHLIRNPQQIAVQEGLRGVERIAIVAEDGTKQVIALKEPLALPPASAGA